MYDFLRKFSIAILLTACGAQVDRPNLPSVGWDSVTVAFSGDVMQHLPQISAARQSDGSYDYTSVFRYVAPFWRGSDFAVINLETTLADRPPYTGYPMFRSPKSLATALAQAGVTHAALANNHAMDAGPSGVDQTLAALNQAQITPLGVSTNGQHLVWLKKGKFRIALFNATYGTNGMPIPKGVTIGMLDTLHMGQWIDQAKRQNATHIIAFVHWGAEYKRSASAEQQAMAGWLRNRGADAVVGSHPHVVQQIDTRRAVVYSLGNFVSNQRERYKRSGLSVRLTLYDRVPGVRISYLAHHTAADYTVVTPDHAHDTSASEFNDVRQAINQPL